MRFVMQDRAHADAFAAEGGSASTSAGIRRGVLLVCEVRLVILIRVRPVWCAARCSALVRLNLLCFFMHCLSFESFTALAGLSFCSHPSVQVALGRESIPTDDTPSGSLLFLVPVLVLAPCLRLALHACSTGPLTL